MLISRCIRPENKKKKQNGRTYSKPVERELKTERQILNVKSPSYLCTIHI